MADEHKQVEAIMGPYRGQRLTMTAADADAAVNAHWARDPFAEPEPGEGTRANEVRAPKEGEAEQQSHPPLTDEERTAAYEASLTWARAQWDAAAGIEPPDPPPPEGGTTTEAMRRRSLKPDPDDTSGYKTRGR